MPRSIIIDQYNRNLQVFAPTIERAAVPPSGIQFDVLGSRTKMLASEYIIIIIYWCVIIDADVEDSAHTVTKVKHDILPLKFDSSF